MSEDELVALEACIERIPGVLGCSILTDRRGEPAEIQAFSMAGSDRDAIQSSILGEAAALGVSSLRGVYVFELETSTDIDDRHGLHKALEEVEEDSSDPIVSLERAAQAIDLDRGGRPRFVRVALSSSTHTSVAEVALGDGPAESTGQAVGGSNSHELEMVVRATLAAVAKMASAAERFSLVGVEATEVAGRPAVVVVVGEVDDPEMIGAALLRGTASETAVRATLDAINRRLSLFQE